MGRLSLSVISFVALALSLSPAVQAQGTITTVAGGGIPNNVPALQASIVPYQVVKDASGNLYFSASNLVYKIDPSGILTRVAGNGTEGFSGDGGPATSAEFNNPTGIAVDASGNVFIADTFNDRIREVAGATGIITTVAGNGTSGFSGDGGPATSAELDGPQGIVIDASGNLFLTDGNRIREIVAATGDIQTVAGNGTAGFSGDGGLAVNAELNDPIALALDHSGNLFVADGENQRIREVLAATEKIQTIAGNGTFGFSGDNGPATDASLEDPGGVSVDLAGNVFIADQSNGRIREVVETTGNIQTVAGIGTTEPCNPEESVTPCFSGDGGPATGAALDFPTGVFVDGSENIFIADDGNNRIREISASNGIIETVAGNGSESFSGDGGAATDAQLVGPNGVFLDSTGNIFIADKTRVRTVQAGTGKIATVAGNGSGTNSTGAGGPATTVAITVDNVFVDPAGNIFIADNDNYRLWEVSPSTGNIQSIAGVGTGFCDSGVPPCPPLGNGGPATAADLTPTGVYVDGGGNIFVTDAGNSANFVGIRKITTGIINTVAKIGNPSSSRLMGLAVDGAGNMFIDDAGQQNRIWEVLAGTNIVNTVAGIGIPAGFSGDGGPATSASLDFPGGAFVDSAGNLFIADTYNNRIREVDASTGDIETVVGDGTVGFSGDDGPATDAELSLPAAVWGDRSGNLYIADTGNLRIRRVSGAIAIVALTAAPSTAVLTPGGTQQFIAGVTNATNTSVTWSFSPQVGTLSQTGLYTAPTIISTQQTVTVTATSVADTTKTASVTVTLNPPQSGAKPTTTTLTSSLGSPVGGQSVTFTATIATTASGLPTGTVTFMDGSSSIGTGTLNGSDVATLTTATLSVATHSITAQYLGDANFAGSTSTSFKQNVAAAAFAPVLPQTVTAGQSLTIPLTLYQATGSQLTFTLISSGLPAESSCIFSPATVLAGGPPGGTTIQMTFTTTAASEAPAGPAQRWPKWPGIILFTVLAALASATIAIKQESSQRRFAFSVCALVLCVALMVTGCTAVTGNSGQSGTPNAGTSQGPAVVTVIATSGATTASAQISLTVR